MKKINSGQYIAVARAVKIEHEPESDSIYLTFKITDDNFKHKIKANWNDDIELFINFEDDIK